MRKNEHDAGHADHNAAGTRSSAAGETQEPAKVTDQDAAQRSEHETEASWGSEGSAGAERKPHSSSLERKKNA
jgi:hypothetical protein